MPVPRWERVKEASTLLLAYFFAISSVGYLLLVFIFSAGLHQGFIYEWLAEVVQETLSTGFNWRRIQDFLYVTFNLVALNCAQANLFMSLVPLIAITGLARWRTGRRGLSAKPGSVPHLTLRLLNAALVAACLCLAWITFGTALYWFVYRQPDV
jgi:hypothetical protein